MTDKKAHDGYVIGTQMLDAYAFWGGVKKWVVDLNEAHIYKTTDLAIKAVVSNSEPSKAFSSIDITYATVSGWQKVLDAEIGSNLQNPNQTAFCWDCGECKECGNETNWGSADNWYCGCKEGAKVTEWVSRYAKQQESAQTHLPLRLPSKTETPEYNPQALRLSLLTQGAARFLSSHVRDKINDAMVHWYNGQWKLMQKATPIGIAFVINGGLYEGVGHISLTSDYHGRLWIVVGTNNNQITEVFSINEFMDKDSWE